MNASHSRFKQHKINFSSLQSNCYISDAENAVSAIVSLYRLQIALKLLICTSWQIKKINKGGVILWDFISNKKVLHRSYDNKMCFLYNCFLHVMTVGHDSRCIAASERYQTNVKVKANFKTTWLYAFHWSRSIIKSIKNQSSFFLPIKNV